MPLTSSWAQADRRAFKRLNFRNQHEAYSLNRFMYGNHGRLNPPKTAKIFIN